MTMILLRIEDKGTTADRRDPEEALARL
jgi:hypothetical protein